MKWINNRWFKALCASILLYSLVGFLLIPFLIKQFLPKFTEDYTKGKLHIGNVSFNPFTFRLKAGDLSLSEADGQPLTALRGLTFNIDPFDYLSNHTLAISELSLDGPFVNLVQDSNGQLNFVKLAENMPKSSEEKKDSTDSEAIPRVLLKKFKITDGAAKFTDLTGSEPFTKTTDGLELELENLSTLPDSSGVHRFEANLPEGGVVSWNGDTAVNPISSKGEFKVSGLNLGVFSDFVQKKINFSDLKGLVDISLFYDFKQIKGDTHLKIEKFDFKLDKLGLASADKSRSMANLEVFAIENGRLDLTEQNVEVGKILIQKGDMKALKDADGKLDWLYLVKDDANHSQATSKAGATSASVEPQSSEPDRPWKVKLGNLKVEELVFGYSDAKKDYPYSFVVGDFGLELTASGYVGTGIPKVKIDNLTGHVRKVELTPKGQPSLLVLEEFGFDKSSVDLENQLVNLAEMHLKNGHVRASIDNNGAINWLALSADNAGTKSLEEEKGQSPSSQSKPEGTDSIKKTWKLNLQQFRLDNFDADFGDNSKKLPFNVSIGDFGLNFSAGLEFGANQPQGKINEINFGVGEIVLSQNNKKELIKILGIGAAQSNVDLSGQTVRVPTFNINKVSLRGQISEKGQLDLLGLIEDSKKSGDGAVRTEKPVQTVKNIQKSGKLKVKDTDINQTKSTQKPPNAIPNLNNWKIGLDRFSLGDMSVTAEDESHIVPLTVSVGSFGLQFAVQFETGENKPDVKLDKIGFHLDEVALKQGGERTALAKFDRLIGEGGQLDLKKQLVSLKKASLKGAQTALVREKDGRLRPIDAFEVKSKSAEVVAIGDHSNKSKNGKANSDDDQVWNISLGEFALDDMGLSLTDRSFSPELSFNLDQVMASVKNYNSNGKSPVKLDTQFKVRQGGKFSASGSGDTNGNAADVKVKIDRIDLKQLQPLVSRYALLRLDSVNVSSNLDIHYKKTASNPEVKVEGSFGVNDLSLIDLKNGKVFLGWKSLDAAGIRFGVAPDSLVVKEVRVVEPEATIAIAADRSTNISAILNVPAQKAEVSKKTLDKPVATEKSNSPPSKALPIHIERVRVDDGAVDFSDMSLVFPFATKIHDFDGVISGLSLVAGNKAMLEFTGRVDEYGQARIKGSLSPMAFKEYSDINVVFSNLEMKNLSPYSATFAGRKIESGKLDLDLLYKIQNHSLQSENKIVLENFSLGQRVEAPKAIDLPLDMAIALLKDSNGQIKASVPVTGSLDDPKFAVGPLMWDAFSTLIKNAVSAPFNAIGSMLGLQEGEKADAVIFIPGADTLVPAENEKLAKIAEAFKQRPNLKLKIHGQYDPKQDREALNSLSLRRAVAEESGFSLKAGEEPGPVAFGDAESQRSLEKLVTQRLGKQLIDKLEYDYIKQNGKAPQRVKSFAGLTGKASETPDFYEKLFELDIKTESLPDSELTALAERRVKTITEELTVKNRLDRGRVVATKVEANEGKMDKGVEMKLEIAID